MENRKTENRKTENKIKMLAVILSVSVSFLVFSQILCQSAFAISLGVSPSEKLVEIEENTQSIVYFAFSQGSNENETITITTDVDWLTADIESFVLEPMGQKYVKFMIAPLSLGNYNAKIKASTAMLGTVGMRTSETAKLTVSVIQPSAANETSSELEERLKAEASSAISDAQNMIQQARTAGGDVEEADRALTAAMEEFDKGNYETAQRLGAISYDLASEEYQKASAKNIVLDPIKFALIIIGVGASVVVVVMLYEFFRLKGKKESIGKESFAKALGVKCPQCGTNMLVGYDGTLISSYVCPKCKYRELKEKYGFK